MWYEKKEWTIDKDLLHEAKANLKVQQDFFNQLHQLEFIPSQILVNSEMAYYAIYNLATPLGIDIHLAPEVSDFKEFEKDFSDQMFGKDM